MLRKAMLALASLAMMAAAAHADPIEGTYRTPETGATAKVAACGGSFCMTYTSGEHSGKQFATMKPNGDGTYSGKLRNYAEGGKEYTGKAKIQGRDIVVSGCVLGGIICKSRTFKRL